MIKKIIKITLETIITVVVFYIICHYSFEVVLRYPGKGDPYEYDFIYDAIVAAPVLICSVIWISTSRIIRVLKHKEKSSDCAESK